MGHTTELVDLVDPQGNITHRGVPRYGADLPEGSYLQFVRVAITDRFGRWLLRQLAPQVGGDMTIDFVSGIALAGETSEQAAVRLAQAEAGLTLANVRLVKQGVDTNGRYRYLLLAESDVIDPYANSALIEWAAWFSSMDVMARSRAVVIPLVEGFVDDFDAAKQAIDQPAT